MMRTHCTLPIAVPTVALYHHDGYQHPMFAVLIYAPTDPLAVTLRIADPDGEPIDWIFARDLFDDGTVTLAGLGDVQIWPVEDHSIAVHLTGEHDQAALLHLPAADVEEFLDRAYRAVPAETETIDIEHTINRILETTR